MRLLIFLLIVFVSVLAIGLTFTVGNVADVSLNYFISQERIPLVDIIIMSFGTGVLLTVIASLLVIVPLWLRLNYLNTQVEQQAMELNALREHNSAASSSA